MNRERIEAAVRAARMPDGRPRFYRPGEHPAHARQRAMLEKLRELDRISLPPNSERIAQAVAMCERDIAIVEEGQRRDLQAFVEVIRARADQEEER